MWDVKFFREGFMIGEKDSFTLTMWDVKEYSFNGSSSTYLVLP